MAYSLQEARELVVEAGHRLVESGLIARTWGNVSARISDTQFVITPSGRAYEDLTPDQIVICNIADCSHEGDIKPSSEKGIHADAYALRPDVNFVIHTHQVMASAVSATGLGIAKVPDEYADLLGKKIPNSSYGIPSTGKLRKGVAAAVRKNPGSTSVLMRHHGAMCMGIDFDDAFAKAQALEKVCTDFIDAQAEKQGVAGNDVSSDVPDLGKSIRHGKQFDLTMSDGTVYKNIDIKTCISDECAAPRAAAYLHAAVYKATDMNAVEQMSDPQTVALSLEDRTVYPRLDDFAQLIGPDMKTVFWDRYNKEETTDAVIEALRGRNAVLIHGAGALCTGGTQGDCYAAGLVTSKDCETERVCALFGKGKILSKTDCLLQRTVYLKKYSKQVTAK